MTGVIGAENVLSKLTIGGLQDLGYAVRYDQAEDFIIPEDSLCVSTSRNLRGQKEKEHSWHVLDGDHSRHLSEKDLDTAVSAGEKFLEGGDSDMVDVIFEDEDGNVFTITVDRERN